MLQVSARFRPVRYGLCVHVRCQDADALLLASLSIASGQKQHSFRVYIFLQNVGTPLLAAFSDADGHHHRCLWMHVKIQSADTHHMLRPAMLVVKNITPDGPASRNPDIYPGDVICGIDGIGAQGLSMMQVSTAVRVPWCRCVCGPGTQGSVCDTAASSVIRASA